VTVQKYEIPNVVVTRDSSEVRNTKRCSNTWQFRSRKYHSVQAYFGTCWWKREFSKCFWIAKHIRFDIFREVTDARRDTLVQVTVEKRTYLSKSSWVKWKFITISLKSILDESRPVARFYGLRGKIHIWGAKCLFLLYFFYITFFWAQQNFWGHCPEYPPGLVKAIAAVFNLVRERSKVENETFTSFVHLLPLFRLSKPGQNRRWRSFDLDFPSKRVEQ